MRAMLALLLLGGLGSPLHARQQTDTTFAVEPGGELGIDNHRGAVRIRSWDRAAMRVVAVHSSRIHIEIERSATGVELEGEARRGPAHGIDYDVTVPRDYSVEVDCNDCRVLVQEVDGDIVVDNVQGDIEVRGGRGRIELESVNDDIIVTGARGVVIAHTNNGSVSMSDIAADDVNAETLNGSIQYQGTLRNGGRYSLSTNNGDISVTIPEDVNVDVNVSTHNGAVEADFPIQVRGTLQQGEMSFVIGNGGARLDLESFNGTIRLLRPE